MTHTQHRRPLWLGLIVAPWVAPAAFSVGLAAYAGATTGLGNLSSFFGGVALFFAFGVPIGYVAVVLLGLPYVLWLRRIGRLTTLNICAGAAVAGAVTFTVFWAATLRFEQPLWYYSLFGALFGLASGLAFAVAVGPNNSSKPKSLSGSA